MVLNKFAFFLSLSSTKFLISLNSQKQSKLFASLIKFFLQPWISKDFDLNFDRLESKKF